MAEKKQAEKQADQSEGSGEKKSLNIWPILKGIFILGNLGITFAGAALVYMGTIGYHPPQITEKTEKAKLEANRDTADEHPVIYTMEKFTVNLDGSPQRTIRLEINLEMLGQEGFEEVVRMGAESRDAIVRILNGTNFSTIESIQGKLFLKDQIQKKINGLLVKGVVKDVYFTEFVVGAGR